MTKFLWIAALSVSSAAAAVIVYRQCRSQRSKFATHSERVHYVVQQLRRRQEKLQALHQNKGEVSRQAASKRNGFHQNGRVKNGETNGETMRPSSDAEKLELLPICTRRLAKESVTTRSTSVYKERCFQVDIDDLCHVLSLDKDKETVWVEPRVTMGELTDLLVPQGWSLPVVPELRQLTVGGVLLGAGLETSSHKFGLIRDFCVAYEVAFADGTVKKITREDDEELFLTIPFSYGTFCLLLSCELRVIPAKPFVKLHYYHVRSEEEAIQKLCEFSQNENWKASAKARPGGRQVNGYSSTDNKAPNDSVSGSAQSCLPDFVEGLLYSPESGVIVVGEMVDESEVEWQRVFSMRYHWHEWYYKHVHRMFLSTAGVSTDASTDAAVPSSPRGNKDSVSPLGYEFIRLEEYYHRHDRGVFWTLEWKFPFSHSLLSRVLFGWILDRRFRLLFPDRKPGAELDKERKRTVQDAVVPASEALRVLKEFNKGDMFQVFPVWLCPLKIMHQNNHKKKDTERSDLSLLHFPPQHDLYIDIGVYGQPKAPDYCPIATHRKMEELLRQVQGFVGHYAVSYTTEAEFWQIYNKGMYHRIRQRTKAHGAFPDIYDKIGGGWLHNRHGVETI